MMLHEENSNNLKITISKYIVIMEMSNNEVLTNYYFKLNEKCYDNYIRYDMSFCSLMLINFGPFTTACL